MHTLIIALIFIINETQQFKHQHFFSVILKTKGVTNVKKINYLVMICNFGKFEVNTI